MAEHKPLMAQAFGDSVGATKRQIQIWTDAGLLNCLRGTNRQGRGRQRLYDHSEKPAAAFISRLAAYGIPIGDIGIYSSLFRACLSHLFDKKDGDNSRNWYRDALYGKHESWIMMERKTNTSSDPLKLHINLIWVDRNTMIRKLEDQTTYIVMNVMKTLTPYT